MEVRERGREMEKATGKRICLHSFWHPFPLLPESFQIGISSVGSVKNKNLGRGKRKES